MAEHFAGAGGGGGEGGGREGGGGGGGDSGGDGGVGGAGGDIGGAGGDIGDGGAEGAIGGGGGLGDGGGGLGFLAARVVAIAVTSMRRIVMARRLFPPAQAATRGVRPGQDAFQAARARGVHARERDRTCGQHHRSWG